ncbi:MAG TPA: hypothetical protein VJ436_08180 [Anaerolineales bacterium]|nr:hypothetical protein [Anaerolineales bacterium]
MILRGFLIAASGFLFIFSPGLPIGLLSRRSPSFNRELIYWGMGLWLVSLIPSLFIQSLMRQALLGGGAGRDLSSRPMDYTLTLLGALLTALIVVGAMALLLRWRKVEPGALEPNGLALGFGIGLIAQIFTGLGLVSSGFRLMFGDVSTPTLATLAQSGVIELVLGLLPLILFRPALLAVSAAQGVLAGRALRAGQASFWLAVLVGGVFTWAILAVQLAFGAQNPGQFLLGSTDLLNSLVTSVYYLLAFALAYRWLTGQMAEWENPNLKRKR